MLSSESSYGTSNAVKEQGKLRPNLAQTYMYSERTELAASDNHSSPGGMRPR